MISMDHYSSMSSGLSEAPPEVSAWPSRAGKPRVDLSQLHMNLISLDKQYRASLEESTPSTNSPCNMQELPNTTKCTAFLRSSIKPNSFTQLRRTIHKEVRFSEEEPVVIVYEQVDIEGEPQLNRGLSLRRRNVDVTPIKNVNYEGKNTLTICFTLNRSMRPILTQTFSIIGSFSSKSASCSNLLGTARIDVPIKEARTSASSFVSPIQIPTLSTSPLDIGSPATPTLSPVMQGLSPSTSSDSSIDTPLTPVASQSSPIISPVRRVSKLRSFLSFRRAKGQAAF
ncbi:hypothetical protein NQZ79_g1542 [Umbelopsis isabellina]|nr:hypothetical protein NQZ79_g1542 [Umbelopsis isabellina]